MYSTTWWFLFSLSFHFQIKSIKWANCAPEIGLRFAIGCLQVISVHTQIKFFFYFDGRHFDFVPINYLYFSSLASFGIVSRTHYKASFFRTFNISNAAPSILFHVHNNNVYRLYTDAIAYCPFSLSKCPAFGYAQQEIIGCRSVVQPPRNQQMPKDELRSNKWFRVG